jgi:hypothetical protein
VAQCPVSDSLSVSPLVCMDGGIVGDLRELEVIVVAASDRSFVRTKHKMT